LWYFAETLFGEVFIFGLFLHKGMILGSKVL
jgi:hypothetical protein